MSAGYGHSCALDLNGYATCWGIDWGGRLEAPEVAFSMISIGRAHGCGINLQGEILCWGDLYLIDPVPTGTYVGVSSGSDYSCAWDSSGNVTCWGQNSYGQIESPTGSFTEVMTSDIRSCGLRTSGIIECWGGGLLGLDQPQDQMMDLIHFSAIIQGSARIFAQSSKPAKLSVFQMRIRLNTTDTKRTH